jgi:hypothetical protein
MRLRSIFSMCLMALSMPLLTSESFAEDIVQQMLRNVALAKPKYESDEMAKMGVLSGWALFIKYSSVSGGAKIITKVGQDCYKTANQSKHMSNIMACFTLEYTIANLIERKTGTRHLRKSATDQAREIMAANGINDQVQSMATEQFYKSWQKADTWLASQTLAKLDSCMAHGYGTKQCQ